MIFFHVDLLSCFFAMTLSCLDWYPLAEVLFIAASLLNATFIYISLPSGSECYRPVLITDISLTVRTIHVTKLSVIVLNLNFIMIQSGRMGVFQKCKAAFTSNKLSSTRCNYSRITLLIANTILRKCIIRSILYEYGFLHILFINVFTPHIVREYIICTFY